MEKHCPSNAVHGSARSAQTLSPHEVAMQLAISVAGGLFPSRLLLATDKAGLQ